MKSLILEVDPRFWVKKLEFYLSDFLCKRGLERMFDDG